jgi:hypothetical protein
MTEEIQNNPTPIKPTIYDETTFFIDIKSVKTTTINNFLNVVKSISWDLIATYNNESIAIERITEFEDDELQDLSDFISYENLNKDLVVSWITSRTPMLHLEYTLCNNLNKLKLPTLNQPPLPWNN